MASTPALDQASHTQPHPDLVAKPDSQAAVEDVMKQYEFMKLNAAEPGEKSFVWPEDRRPNIAHDQYDCNLPIIDLSPVLELQSLRSQINQLEGEPETRTKLETEIKACEAAKFDIANSIRAACEEYGFFQIVNSGFPMDVVEKFREIYQQLFDLPYEVTKLCKSMLARPSSSQFPQQHKLNLSNMFDVLH
jgi:hypothetical protein